MLARILCVTLAASVAITSLPPPADAQFGIRRAFKKVVRAPARILPGVAAPVIGGVILFGGPFRKAFGVVAAVAVGVVIFEHLSRHERREVARRAKVVVAKDPEQRVSDTYTSKDGKKQVTIVAEPTQKASDLKDDPAILVAADTVVAPDAGKGASPPSGYASDSTGSSTATDAAPPAAPPADAKKPAAKPVVDEELVRIGEIPPDTQCRKVTTELELRKKKGQETADEKTTNTAIFCQTAPGEWKPAST
ncbi:hypothetical protein [Hyphomicrobium sp.]|uniref:hypothetical protein n=1 Tax=Hyphomicrobium sp. TaxID=82 RepID=UPI0025C047F6|nr:hypothetical protein [Hyphomicrobium sp.]MCC7252160.1 hypothetical protein [Hyphomicrobium sp.]